MLGNTVVQKNKFQKLIQKVSAKYLGRDAAYDQRVVMMMGKLQYEGKSHDKVTNFIFEISNNLERFNKETNYF